MGFAYFVAEMLVCVFGLSDVGLRVFFSEMLVCIFLSEMLFDFASIADVSKTCSGAMENANVKNM